MQICFEYFIGDAYAVDLRYRLLGTEKPTNQIILLILPFFMQNSDIVSDKATQEIILKTKTDYGLPDQLGEIT